MIENALRSILLNYPLLTSKIVARIYPLEFPDQTKPSIIYQKVSDPDEGSHKELLIQYVVHSATYTQAEEIIGLVWKAFKAFDSGNEGAFKIHTIEQTGQIGQSSDRTVPLYERSEIFRVLYSEE
ncbi:MAG TPA: hypothetical protein PK955_02045 [Methanoregulaceae archaeon]|nr:hypothetical protein [Methanoregulaceae archaeon]